MQRRIIAPCLLAALACAACGGGGSSPTSIISPPDQLDMEVTSDGPTAVVLWTDPTGHNYGGCNYTYVLPWRDGHYEPPLAPGSYYIKAWPMAACTFGGPKNATTMTLRFRRAGAIVAEATSTEPFANGCQPAPCVELTYIVK